MKKICKIICRVLWIFICFILVNLVIWTIVYWWTKKYSEVLNQKDWQYSISEISILKPKTRFSIFYKNWQNDIEKKIEDNILDELDTESSSDVENFLNEFLSWNSENIEEATVNHNPYDPDYEDEFNSFFWWSSEENSEIIPVEEIENLEPAGFVVDESTED